jgi:hypothetical protein
MSWFPEILIFIVLSPILVFAIYPCCLIHLPLKMKKKQNLAKLKKKCIGIPIFF